MCSVGKNEVRNLQRNIIPEYLVQHLPVKCHVHLLAFNDHPGFCCCIIQHNIKTLFVDASNADFLGNEEHIKVIVDALDKEYEDGQHYLSLP